MARLAKCLGLDDGGRRVERVDLDCDEPWALYSLNAEVSIAWLQEVIPIETPAYHETPDPLQDLFWDDADTTPSIH